ncbi:hypothetical protein Scep_011020 [Stephania cephalantha]|uniref:Uncharacterized protein n=1 Tax=Stephania cephalantha TaxID=152367 RepID=A0AAP0PFV3_9MAGN
MAIVLRPNLTPPSSTSLVPSNCQFCQTESSYCLMSPGTMTKCSIDGRRASDSANIRFRCINPMFGAAQTHRSLVGQDLTSSIIRVAADHSDSISDISNFMKSHGYHPLEELKVVRRRNTMLTSAEMARTTVEANGTAVLVFPGMVHNEPHELSSWAELHYVIDDYGDIFFEIFDDENILEDHWALNPVNVLIGMDVPLHMNKMEAENHTNSSDIDSIDILLEDESFEDTDPDASTPHVDWGTPYSSRQVHPSYFAKCMTKAVNSNYGKRMEHPSNGISILGCLRPAMMDDESYVRRLFHYDGSDIYHDWKGEHDRVERQLPASYNLIEDDILGINSKYDGANISSTFFKLDIMRIELFSVYGIQAAISLDEFQEAEPDFLAHSASAIIERLSEGETKFNCALKALCRRKGVIVERAKLIGVDSLGMDVRAFLGLEARTLRFPFKTRATSESAAEKKIQQMLFPRHIRKKFRAPYEG